MVGFPELLDDGVDELLGGEVLFPGEGVAVEAEGEVLGHEASLDDGDARGLEGLAKVTQLGVAVELGPVREALGPGKDRRHGVRGRLLQQGERGQKKKKKK